MDFDLVTAAALGLLAVLAVVVWRLLSISRGLAEAAIRLKALGEQVARLRQDIGGRSENPTGPNAEEATALREERDELLLSDQSLREELRLGGKEVRARREERDELLLSHTKMREELRVCGEQVEALKEERFELVLSDKSLRKELQLRGEEATALREERDELLLSEKNLRDELRQLQQRAEQNRKLYLLLKSLLNGNELLEVARSAAGSITSSKPSAEAPVGSADSTANAAHPEAKPASTVDPDPFGDDKDHQNAARIARVMVGDLFLYNRSLIGEASDEAKLRRLLDGQYRGARETFESRVPERVWREKHYLEIEFGRMLRKRAKRSDAEAQSGASAPAEPDAGSPSVEVDEHQTAARTARLMVAELFLCNAALLEEGIRGGNLRELLDEPYQAARQVFQSSVPERVWKQMHHLDIELERVLCEAEVRHSLDAEFEQLFQEQFRSSITG